MRKIICVLCAAAMAVTLFGCKPDSGDANSKAVLSNSSTESTEEVSSEMESVAENDATDSSIESDLTESETDETSFSNESLLSQASLLPEKIESMEIKCIDTHEGERLILFINGEETKAPVKWSSNNEMAVSVDQNGYIFCNLPKNEFNHSALITATLANGKYAEYTVSSNGILRNREIVAYSIKDYPNNGLINFAFTNSLPYDNISAKLSDREITINFYAAFAMKTYSGMDGNDYFVKKPNIKYYDNVTGRGVYYFHNSFLSDNYVYYKSDDENMKMLDITWTSSDPAVATVDNNGRVTLHKNGRTLIKAVIKDQFGDNIYSDIEMMEYVYINVV